jgi:16S rRNA (cytidine1402-2'-O)-methyltransferase
MNIYLIPLPLAEELPSPILLPQINEVIKQTSYYLVENIRTARRFVSALQVGVSVASLHFFELDGKTTAKQVEEIFKNIPPNTNVGIMSEAGCPGIADPGALAVAYAHQKNWKVVPLIGASSITLALMASGLNGQSFAFCGYLPIEKAERIKSIAALEKESAKRNQTQIFIETPYRNQVLFDELLQNCHPETKITVAYQLTTPSEVIKTKTVAAWRKNPMTIDKNPCIFLLLG